jgi:hypothetical protein
MVHSNPFVIPATQQKLAASGGAEKSFDYSVLDRMGCSLQIFFSMWRIQLTYAST